MNEPELPDELERLERELAERPCPEPSADLRDRVLRLVEASLDGAELRRAEPARPRAGGWLSFAVATAATVLVWINLSMSAANATSYDLRLPAETDAVDETARQIRRLLPEMSEQESRRYAMILQGSGDLVPCLDVARNPPARTQLNGLDDLLPQGE
jgi:hypothetical protein